MLGDGANERKDACEKDILTTLGRAFGEIAVVAVHGIVLVRGWGYLVQFTVGCFPTPALFDAGLRQRRGSA